MRCAAPRRLNGNPPKIAPKNGPESAPKSATNIATDRR